MASFVLFRQAGFLSSSSKSAFAVQCTLRPLLSSLLISNFSKKMGLPKVYFDMAADNQPLGRIIIEVSEKTRALYPIWGGVLTSTMLVLQVTISAGCCRLRRKIPQRDLNLCSIPVSYDFPFGFVGALAVGRGRWLHLRALCPTSRNTAFRLGPWIVSNISLLSLD